MISLTPLGQSAGAHRTSAPARSRPLLGFPRQRADAPQTTQRALGRGTRLFDHTCTGQSMHTSSVRCRTATLSPQQALLCRRVAFDSARKRALATSNAVHRRPTCFPTCWRPPHMRWGSTPRGHVATCRRQLHHPPTTGSSAGMPCTYLQSATLSHCDISVRVASETVHSWAEP